jgi:hypothetical protein
MVGTCVALPVAMPQLPQLEWNWPLPGSLELGAVLSMLPRSSPCSHRSFPTGAATP